MTNSTSLRNITAALFLIFCLILAWPRAAVAAIVAKCEGKDIMIDDADESIAEGKLFYTVDAQNVRRAVIQVTSVDPPAAQAKLLMGTASPGQNLVPRPEKNRQNRKFTETIPRNSAVFTETSHYMPPTLWRVGGGLSIFTMRGIDSVSPSYQFGFTIGVFRQIPLNKKFSIEPGVQYYQAGTAVNSSAANLELHLDYLGLPLLATYRLLDDSPSDLKLQFGPTLSYLANSSAVASVGNNTYSANNIGTAKTDVLLTLGLLYLLPSGFWMDAAFNYGLANLASTGSAYNQGFLLTAGVSF